MIPYSSIHSFGGTQVEHNIECVLVEAIDSHKKTEKSKHCSKSLRSSAADAALLTKSKSKRGEINTSSAHLYIVPPNPTKVPSKSISGFSNSTCIVIFITPEMKPVIKTTLGVFGAVVGCGFLLAPLLLGVLSSSGALDQTYSTHVLLVIILCWSFLALAVVVCGIYLCCRFCGELLTQSYWCYYI